jgi:hypothetical protein
MTSETIAIYSTRSGKEAMRIDKTICNRGVFYSYIGKYGAGSVSDYKDVQKTVATMKCYHKGVTLTQGSEI